MTNRPLRPLAIFVLLAFGDYLLWNWSLNGNRDILALIAGATLMPLVLAIAWLLVVSVARFLAEAAQRARASAGTGAGVGAGRPSRARGYSARRSAARATAAGRGATTAQADAGAQAAHRDQGAGSVGGTDSSPSTPSSSSKLAA